MLDRVPIEKVLVLTVPFLAFAYLIYYGFYSLEHARAKNSEESLSSIFTSSSLSMMSLMIVAGEPIKSSKTFLLIIKFIQLKLFKLDCNLWLLKIILNNLPKPRVLVDPRGRLKIIVRVEPRRYLQKQKLRK